MDIAGRMYVIAKGINQGLMYLDEEGAFLNFMGAPQVTPNYLDLLWRNFMTEEQIENSKKIVPTEYNSVAMDDKGFLYVSSQSADVPPIARLNSQGTDVLKYRWMTHYASKDNIVRSVANPYGFNGEFTFNNTLNDKIYVVEAPDAMVPADKDAYTIFRYRNTISAGVAYKGDYKVVVLGVPVETFSSQEQIEEFMAQVTGFFEQE